MYTLSHSRPEKLAMLLLILMATSLPTQANFNPVAVVKLYSEGKLVATYNAVDEGRMDQGCYVFHINASLNKKLEVRVCGTFTVEQLR